MKIVEKMKKYKNYFLDIDLSLNKLDLIGVFEGVEIYTHGEDIPTLDLKRVLSKGMNKIKKDYGGQPQLFMIKDYRTKTKLILEFRKEIKSSNKLIGIVCAIYNIDYYPYTNEDEFYSDVDSIKTIEKKLKQKSNEGYFLHYNYEETTYGMDFFEDGVLYHTYETINLDKEKYK